MNAEEKSQPWNCFTYWLMGKLLPGGALAGVPKLLGTHYEFISIIFRLLGSKVRLGFFDSSVVRYRLPYYCCSTL
jgi:hypothetical protein